MARRAVAASAEGRRASIVQGERSMPGMVHVGSGKVRELYALDDERLLLVATDRISTFDVVLPTEIPDKGRVLTGLSAFWFARTRGICPEPSARRPAGWPLDGVPPPADAADRVRRSRLSVRLGLAGLPGHRRGLRAPAAGWAARVRAPARADLHPGHQGGERSRREHHAGAGRCASSGPRAWPRSSGCRSRSTDSPRTTRSSAGSSSPTRSSSSDRTATGALLLGDEALTPDSSRFWPRGRLRARGPAAVLRQAVRARLLRGDGLEQDTSRPRASRGGRRRHPRAVRRGLRTTDRHRLRDLSGRPHGGARMSPEVSAPARLA